MLTKRKKKLVINEYATHETDTGSVPVQIALLSKRVNELTAHLKTHPKDIHSRRGLLKMVGKRRRFMQYLAEHDPQTHAKLAKKSDAKR